MREELSSKATVESCSAIRQLNNVARLCVKQLEGDSSIKFLKILQLPQKFQDTLLEFLAHIPSILEIEHFLLRKKISNGEKKAEKMMQYVCNEDWYLRNKLLLFYQNAISNIKDFDNEQSQHRVKQAEEFAERSKHWAKMMCTLPKFDGILPDVIPDVAASIFRTGRYAYYKTNYPVAIRFFSMATEILTKWITTTGPSQEKKTSHAVWKKFESLGDALRRNQQPQEAMSVVATGLIFDEMSLTSAVELWVKIKAELFRQNKHHLLAKTLWSQMKHEETILGVKDHKCTLQSSIVSKAEFETCKDARWNSHDAQLAILEGLISDAKCPLEKANWLTERTRILWLSRKSSPCTAEESIQEAIELVKDVKINQTSKLQNTDKDIYATANLWCHLVTDIDPVQVRDVLEKINKPSQEERPVSRPGSPTENKEQPESFQDCFTIQMDHHTFQNADRALEAWESAVNNCEGVATVLQSTKSTLEYLGVLSAIYRLADRNVHELRALKVMKMVASQTEHHSYLLHTYIQMTELFCRLKQPHLAQQLVEEATEWLKTHQNLREEHAYIWFLKAQASAYFINAKVSEGYSVLLEALTLKSERFRSKCKDALLVEGALQHIQCNFLGLPLIERQLVSPGGSETDTTSGGHCADVLVQATRYLSGVVCFMLGDWVVTNTKDKPNVKVPENSLNKWAVLCELLDVLYSTGQLFIQLGEPRDAKCYLQQGLRIAQVFHIPRRFAAFHLALSQLNNVCAKYNDSLAHLNTVNFVLNNNTLPAQIDTLSDKKDALDSKDGSEEGLSDNEDGEMIKGQVFDMEDDLTCSVGSRDRCGSPTMKQRTPKLPECWQHKTDCQCEQCVDITTQGLHLRHLGYEADCLRLQGNSKEADRFWDFLLKHFEILTQKAQSALLSHVSENEKTNRKASKSKKKKTSLGNDGDDVKPSFYQVILVDVCSDLIEFALSEHNWELYEEWSRKGLQLVNVEMYPWMLASHMSKAYVTFLQAVPKVAWPKPEAKSQKETVEDLCERVRKVAISVDRTRKKVNKLTHAEEKVKLEILEEVQYENTTPASIVISEDTPESIKENIMRKKGSTRSNGDKTTTRIKPKLEKAEVEKKQKCLLTVANDKDALETPTKSKTVEPSRKSPRLPNKTLHTPRMKGKKVVQKTPANQTRSGIANTGDVDFPQFASMIKTPRSVNSRRAALDMLINSDSDEEIIKTVTTGRGRGRGKSRRGSSTTTTTKGTSRGRGAKSKTSTDENVSSTPLKAVKTAPVTDNKRKTNRLLLDQNEKGGTSLFKASLNKSVAAETDNKHIYDFVLSSDDENQASALKPKRTGRTASSQGGAGRGRLKVHKVENVRKMDEDTDKVHIDNCNILIDSTNLIPDVVVKSASKTKMSGRVRRTGKDSNQAELLKPVRTATRLTRSSTAHTEDHREDDNGADEQKLSLSDSICMPVIDSESEEDDDDELVNLSHNSEVPLLSTSFPIDEVFSPPAVEKITASELDRYILPEESQLLNSSIEAKRGSDSSSSDCCLDIYDIPEVVDDSEHFDDSNKHGIDQSDSEGSSNRLSGGQIVDPEIPTMPGQDGCCEPVEIPRADKDPSTRQQRKSSRSKDKDKETEVPRMSKLKVKSGAKKSQSVKLSPAGEAVARIPVYVETDSSVEERLLQAYAILKHNPAVVPYRSVCHSLAMTCIVSDAVPREADPWQAAFYLTEAQAVTFRHKAILNCSRKIRKLEMAGSSKAMTNVERISEIMEKLSVNTASYSERLQLMRYQLNFGKNVDFLKQVTQELPEDMTVCQISVVGVPGQDSDQMVISRYQRGEVPIVCTMPGFATPQGQRVLPEFGYIMQSNKETMYVTEKVQWWSSRGELDSKLKDLLQHMEDHWLGAWRGILLGPPTENLDLLLQSTTDFYNFATSILGPKASVNKGLLQILLSSCCLLRDVEVKEAICYACEIQEDNQSTEMLTEACVRLAKPLGEFSLKRHPVILILDKDVQQLPWESLPSVQCDSYYRMPSLYFLHAQLTMLNHHPTSVVHRGVNPDHTYYILDPEDNLPATQNQFKDWFLEKKNWKGVIGARPSTEEFTDAITNHDLFLYIGHGSGGKFFSGDTIQTLQAEAVAILMGCSSGKLTADGRLEASGIMLNYFMAGCPAMVANLWDVTDRDIDRYNMRLLKEWSVETTDDLSTVVQRSRGVCRLASLIGTAPVVYGLPVKIKNVHKKQ